MTHKLGMGEKCGRDGQTAEAGHIIPRIHVNQPHLVIVQVPCKASVPQIQPCAGARAAKRQEALLGNDIVVAHQHVGTAKGNG